MALQRVHRFSRARPETSRAQPTSSPFAPRPFPEVPDRRVLSAPNTVVQLMYKDAEIDIEGILDEIRPADERNESDALAISKDKALDATTEEQIRRLTSAVALDVFKETNILSSALLEALSQGHTAFAKKLLEIIVQPASEVPEVTEDDELPETPSFADVAEKAVRSYLPEILKKVDSAQKAAALKEKQVLVMVGEKHDDPYSKLFEAVLLGVLKLQNLFIEATPAQVEEHVEPYQDQEKKPNAPDDNVIGHRQRFYRYLYEKGATVTGVDVDKESAKQEIEKKLGPPPINEPALSEWKAKLMEQSVVLRNQGIVRTLAKAPASGILIVGATHLPGLAAAPELTEAYEIVSITTLMPDVASARDKLIFDRELSTTRDLKSMDKLAVASEESLTGFSPEQVPASEVFKMANDLVIEINTI